jgi:hypothetical protein
MYLPVDQYCWIWTEKIIELIHCLCSAVVQAQGQHQIGFKKKTEIGSVYGDYQNGV